METEIFHEHPASGQRGHQGRGWSVQKDRRVPSTRGWGVAFPHLSPLLALGTPRGRDTRRAHPGEGIGNQREEAQERGVIPEKEGKPLGRENGEVSTPEEDKASQERTGHP